jgi:hypothetical protein
MAANGPGAYAASISQGRGDELFRTLSRTWTKPANNSLHDSDNGSDETAYPS